MGKRIELNDDRQHSLRSARAAGERDELANWVAQFLVSASSDNAVLARELSEQLGWWVGPVRLPIDELHRLAGPVGDPVLCPVDEGYWDDRVDAIYRHAEEGWEPPPVIVAYRLRPARCRGGQPPGREPAPRRQEDGMGGRRVRAPGAPRPLRPNMDKARAASGERQG
jgi:hypothetical protein